MDKQELALRWRGNIGLFCVYETPKHTFSILDTFGEIISDNIRSFKEAAGKVSNLEYEAENGCARHRSMIKGLDIISLFDDDCNSVLNSFSDRCDICGRPIFADGCVCQSCGRELI